MDVDQEEDDEIRRFRLGYLWHNFKRLFEIDREIISLNYPDSVYILDQALRSFNYDVVKYLLRRGTKLNDLPNCAELFLEVVARGHNNLAELLIEHGADVNSFKGKIVDCPLVMAVCSGNSRMTTILLKHGAVVKLLNPEAKSLLEYALESSPDYVTKTSGYVETIQVLLKHGVYVNNGFRMKPLEQAILKKSYRIAEILLKYGADFKQCSPEMIHKFIQDASKYEEGEKEAIQTIIIICIIILQGFSANSLDLSGSSVLHYAARGRNIALVETLLDNGAHINLIGGEGLAPLHIAIRESNLEIAEILLERGADPILIDSFDRMPLHYAVTEDCARLLLNSNNNNIDKLDREGFTALHYSLMKGKYRISDLLLEAGANIDVKSIGTKPFLEDRGNLLHKAIKRCKWDIIKLLLNSGIDVNSLHRGYTPIQVAIKEGLLGVVRLLLEHKADTELMDRKGRKAIHLVIKNHNGKDILLKLVTLLLEWKVDVNALDQYGSSPMHYAASSSSDLSSVIKFLLDRGANPELKDQNGRRPIHLASNIENLKCLIDHGVDINAQDDGGYTALHNAESLDVINLLLRASDMDVTT